MIKKIKKYIKEIELKDPEERNKIGHLLIILGIVGIILPIIPGLLLILTGIKIKGDFKLK